MKNEVLSCIETRRSVRAYERRQVEEEKLRAVLRAGTFAASGMGRQAAQIVVVQDAETIGALSRLNAEIWGTEGDHYYGAPTLLLVFADSEVRTFVEDGCCVLTTLMLAAHAVGLGTCWINRERQMFEREEGRELMRRWGLSSSMKGIGALSLGYPAEEPKAPAPRKADYIKRV